MSETGIAFKDQPPRGSLHSIRKGSYDVKSLASDSGQSIRRQSLAKLNSLPIEAPITKIITLLYSVHEQSSGHVQLQIEKVLDILRSTELYSPQLKENRIRMDDPITADLISALLSVSVDFNVNSIRHFDILTHLILFGCSKAMLRRQQREEVQTIRPI